MQKKLDGHSILIFEESQNAISYTLKRKLFFGCSEIPKFTQNELRFGLIWFEIMSHRFFLGFILKYVSSMSNICLELCMSIALVTC